MKISAAISILFLSATSLAAPASPSLRKRQCNGEPSTDAVIQAINTWRADVVAVNDFLNNAATLSPDDLLSAAQSTLATAQNEPHQLDILACIQAIDDAAQILNLQETFLNVPNGLQNIINNPSDPENVRVQLQVINGERCCNVLPDLDVIWQAAATDYGVANIVDTSVPRPSACGTTTFC